MLHASIGSRDRHSLGLQILFKRQLLMNSSILLIALWLLTRTLAEPVATAAVAAAARRALLGAP